MSEVATDWAVEPEVVVKLTPPRVHCAVELVPLDWASALGQVYGPVLSAGQLPWPLIEPEVAVQPLGTGMVRPSMGSETVCPLPPVTVGAGDAVGAHRPPPPPRPPFPEPVVGVDCESTEAVLVEPPLFS